MTNVDIFYHNFVRTLDDCMICIGYGGYVNVSFNDMEWKNSLMHRDGAYTKFHRYHDNTGLSR